MAKQTKTNAMRELERAGIPFEVARYDADGPVSGEESAAKLGVSPDVVFKTLVTRAKSGQPYVFVVPAARTLDLKKASRAAGEKSVEMVHVKELERLTGYVRGACSPVGMKKRFPAVIDASAQEIPEFLVSAGRFGTSLRLAPEALAAYLGASFADIVQP